MANVTETLDAFIAPKKHNQCNAIINPARKNRESVFGEKRSFSFFRRTNNNINPEANNILNQTNGMASIEIKAPNTAVNPQINTIPCK